MREAVPYEQAVGAHEHALRHAVRMRGRRLPQTLQHGRGAAAARARRTRTARACAQRSGRAARVRAVPRALPPQAVAQQARQEAARAGRCDAVCVCVLDIAPQI